VILDTATAGWYRYYIDTELTGQPLDSVQWTKFFTHDLLAPVGWAIALAGVGLIVGWSRKATRTAWPSGSPLPPAWSARPGSPAALRRRP